MITLFGRERELDVINDLLDRIDERGSGLVVRGEPGIGKSILLRETVERARDRGVTVLCGSGVQSEAQLPFAGLHQLLSSMLGRAEALPVRQREALAAAFGAGTGTAPEPFIIGLAALNLLGEAATRAPLLLMVDDVQWLDQPTVDVLGFVARRIGSEPIVLLMAIRDGYATTLADCGLPELRVRRLDEAAAATLLDEHAAGLGPGARSRVLEEAAGNPLALIELPMALDDEGPVTEAGFLPLTTRLERAFAARVAELPPVTGSLLVIAAADDGGAIGELLSAAELVVAGPVPVSALAPAVEAGLLEADEFTVRFRHPLVRSAVYQGASFPDRLAAHAALSEVLTRDPDRRAWHRAAATLRMDESVAAELEAVADRARCRGAITVAVTALERSAKFSEDAARQGDRLLRAAELAFELGRRDLVTGLVAQAEPLELGSLERDRLTWLREVFEEGLAGGAAQVHRLLQIAERVLAEGDQALSMNFVRAAAMRCWWSDPGPEIREQVIAAAERMPMAADKAELMLTLAMAAPVERGRTVLEWLARPAATGGQDAAGARQLGTAATVVGAFDLATGHLAVAVSELRAQGRLGLLAQALVSQAFAAIRTAQWTVAMPAAEEAERLARETGQARWAAGAQAAAATLAGLRGEEERAYALATAAEQVLLPMANTSSLGVVQIARGLTALGAGRYGDAYGHLRRMFDVTDPVYNFYVRTWAIGDLAEAAVGAGNAAAARTAVRELEAAAALTPSPLLQLGMRYARALLADDTEAEALFQTALEADLTRWPMDRARLLLAYGTWLRRQRRVAESRTPLRAARDAFDILGTVPWGERARHELRASGETSAHRTPVSWGHLTPQELQIARMAAEGLSNREIAQQLYLSHRTVGAHLYRLFPKLGVTSRTQLRDILGESLQITSGS